MPGFQDRLPEEEVDRLLAYLRTLEGPPTFHRTPSPPDPAAVARGRALFRERCESCHLDGGRKPGVGLGFEPPAPVLADEVRRHTPAFIARQIREGGGQMPAIGGDLTDAQVADLIAYLSALALESGGRR
ncbi:Cytochrome c6 [Candidatus Thermoflexus japonica]|uniref:Cytochrome c6 n=1 Tax=Candidatus Thermoflexus japonica TaxID=2035417 RepID=A0A2H5Y9S9_9CHLR|nr:Cytochrome c6 [Candidatus Thermoflexus japonica]